MTHFIPKFLSCITMALIFGDVNVVLLVWIIVSGFSRHTNSLSLGSDPQKNSASKNAIKFYQRCENLIKRELEDMSEWSLSKEVKLAGMSNTIGGPIHFYPVGGRVHRDSPMFSWKSKSNPYLADDLIVVGVYEKSSKHGFMPLGWMSGAFVALRKLSGYGATALMSKIHYYALVAYVRKDYNNGSSEFIEWDRFSPRIVRNLFQKETDVEVGESFTIETLMCSYGTCSCAACKCDGKQANFDKHDDDDHDHEPANHNNHSQSQRVTWRDDDPGTNITTSSPNKPAASGNEVNDTRRGYKRRKLQGVASTIAKSSKGSARSKSEASEKGKNSVATSITEGGIAVAESISHKGGSSAVAESKNDSLAESMAGKGGARSKSVTRKGAAQSSSQSRGGYVEAEATQIGSDEYNYYDEEIQESDEDFDAKTLVRDTNKKFADANARSDKLKFHNSDDLCLKESSFEVNLTLAEFRVMMDTDPYKEEHKRLAKKNEHPSFLYRNPTRFGIDVEVGVNSSVLIATVIPGFVVPRGSCCGLEANSTSIISDFLRTFRQDCNSDLETQVKRLEVSFHNTTVAEIMQTKRLSLHQLRDLVPMILLTVHQTKSTKRTIKLLKKTFNNSASDHINKIVAVIIHGAHFAMTDGNLHKVKILKGLVLNVRTVLLGILLEFKRCKKDTSEDGDCSFDYQERLKVEKKLILGLYYFLKFADSRHTYFNFRKDRPAELYVDFMKTHTQHISKLVYCKSRRIIMNSA